MEDDSHDDPKRTRMRMKNLFEFARPISTTAANPSSSSHHRVESIGKSHHRILKSKPWLLYAGDTQASLFISNSRRLPAKAPSSRGGRARACNTLQRRLPLDPFSANGTSSEEASSLRLAAHPFASLALLSTYIRCTAVLRSRHRIFHVDAVKLCHAGGVVLAAETCNWPVLPPTRQGCAAAMLRS